MITKMVLAFCVLIPQLVLAQATVNLNGVANRICGDLLSSDEPNIRGVFAEELRPFMADLFFQLQEMHEVLGDCDHAELVSNDGSVAKYTFFSLAKNQITLDFSVNAQERLTLLHLDDINLIHRPISDWAEAKRYFDDLPGEVAFTVKTQKGFHKEVLRPTRKNPLGNAFQLYILSALAAKIKSGGITWRQEMSIRESMRSLGGGEMQTWEVGKPAPISEFAAKMVAADDNTASDHLLWLIGRGNVEKELKNLRNSFRTDNTPFLSTAQIYKLKWAAPQSLMQSFLEGDDNRQSELLQKIDTLPLDLVGTNGVDMQAPSQVDTVEWFGSTDDVCVALFALNDTKSPEILKLLSLNVPLVHGSPSSYWQYAGYKGGIEPGVLSMNYLLKTQSGKVGCIAVSWKSSSQKLNQFVLYDFVKKILKLSEATIQ